MRLMNPKMADYFEGDGKSFCSGIHASIQIAQLANTVRKAELVRWSRVDAQRFKKWFGGTDERARLRMQTGLQAMGLALNELHCGDFLPYTEEAMAELGCAWREEPHAVAAVCPVPGPVKIMLGKGFFELKDFRPSGPSRPLVLLHELAHLPQIFGTRGLGETYTLFLARQLAQTDPMAALNNSDNIAGYIMDLE